MKSMAHKPFSCVEFIFTLIKIAGIILLLAILFSSIFWN